MSEKVFFSDVDQLHVKQGNRISETKTIGVVIHQFLKDIELQDATVSPGFGLGGNEFCIMVRPTYKNGHFIRMDLFNCTGETPAQ